MAVLAVRSLLLEGRHASLGARFAEFAGWRMPLWYEGALKEHMAVRTDAGLFDVSHMGRFRVTGPEASASLASVLSRDVQRLAPGRATYALACNSGGGIIDDLMVYRLSSDAFVVICNAANAASIEQVISRSLPASSAVLSNVQEQTVLFAVQGPDAVARVATILPGDVAALPRRGCRELVVDAETYFVARTGYTGEDGFEIMTSSDPGSRLFDALIAAGFTPCGLAARDSLRLEAALPLYGSDIAESTSPWDAGLGWAVDLDHEFTGHDALRVAKDTVSRHLTCIVSDGQGVFRSHQDVYHDGEIVGSVSSGGFSPMLDISIAMAYLPSDFALSNGSLEIDIRGRRVPCHTVRRPFYKRPLASQPERSSP